MFSLLGIVGLIFHKLHVVDIGLYSFVNVISNGLSLYNIIHFLQTVAYLGAPKAF